MSHRTRLDISTQRAYRSVSEILLIAFMARFLSQYGVPPEWTNRSADAAICKAVGGPASKTGPPADMTETPDSDRKAGMDAASCLGPARSFCYRATICI